jgi:hypothetical protein
MWWLKALLSWTVLSLVVSAFIGRFVGGRDRDPDPD